LVIEGDRTVWIKTQAVDNPIDYHTGKPTHLNAFFKGRDSPPPCTAATVIGVECADLKHLLTSVPNGKME
jgi:hypothetical protein